MIESDFIQLCKEFKGTKDRSVKANVMWALRNQAKLKLNRHGVFINTKHTRIIDHKTVQIEIEHLHTPAGVLAIFEYMFSNGSGAMGPLVASDVVRGDFVSDLNAFARKGVQHLVDTAAIRGYPEVAVNALKRYLKQTEQLSLFDQGSLAVLR